MFNEYTLRPDARGKLILNTALQGCVYFVSALFIYFWLRFLEPETLELIGSKAYIILAILALASILLMVRLYTSGIKFRMITTDLEIQFTRMGNSISVKYADLLRVERTPNNTLLFYTVASATKPVIAVSDTITDRSRFEKNLMQFIPITEVSIVPWSFRVVPRLLFTYLYMTALFLNLISGSSNTVIGTGIAVAGLSVYSIATLIRFRHEIKRPTGIIIMILLTIIMLVRIYFAFHPGVFPNNLV